MGQAERSKETLARPRRVLERTEQLAKFTAEIQQRPDDPEPRWKLGNVAAEGRLNNLARQSYRAALAIRERLAKADPGNAGWQRDFAVSHNKFGDVQRAQGDLPAALASYRASFAIAERLAKADPGNTEWQRDL